MQPNKLHVHDRVRGHILDLCGYYDSRYSIGGCTEENRRYMHAQTYRNIAQVPIERHTERARAREREREKKREKERQKERAKRTKQTNRVPREAM